MSLIFENIYHAYGQNSVLEDITFEAPSGEITCLIGPSGSGKSTLLRIAAGLEYLQKGRLILDGEPLVTPQHQPPPEQRPIGLVFQENTLFPHMTVARNIAFGIEHLPGKQRTKRINDLLDSVGLGDYGDRYPHTLSGGQQQRIALIRSLAPEPRILLMDEPYANIDSTRRRTLRETARLTLKQKDTITILVTHDPQEAMEMADKVIVLNDKQVIQTGSPEELYQTPADVIVATLFGGAQAFHGVFKGHYFQTPYGPIDLNDRANYEQLHRDQTYHLAMRPEGLNFSISSHPEPEHNALQVSDIRFMGNSKLIFAAPQNSSKNLPLLRIMDRGDIPVAIGDRLKISSADSGFFQFPESFARDTTK